MRASRIASVLAGLLAFASASGAQTPQPFPRSNQPAQPSAPPPSTPPVNSTLPPPAATAEPAVVDPRAPSPAELGFPVYPTASFIASYDAGRGQRYYLFGSSLTFAEMVAYYRTSLKERGNLVFDAPPTHMFEVGRFREDSMAFPPGVTIKDYTWGGSAGYPNPKRGEQPERFATIIQIVPPPALAAPGRR
ncbi:MAG: hypothetical protein FJW23_02585 [Acidimicrobiia bacterium]|nr:hypothetical protein [Acidimicrobiia bacterium]